MTKLTDTQVVIEHANGAVQPLSTSLDKGAATSAFKSLLKRRLIAERASGKDDTAWREVDGQPMTLGITDAGREAFGVEPEPAPWRWFQGL